MLAAASQASTDSPGKILRVYGPGGPHHVLEECANLFREQHGVEVAVIRALPHELEQKLREDGDIYYGGAEYMLEQFDRRNPGVLDMASVEKLHPRRIGIVVRKGNPLNIQGVEDLKRTEVDLLDVKLENMRQLHGTLPGKIGDIRRFVYTGQEGASTWLAIPEIDAWVTYKSWHVSLEADSDFVEIPGDQALRFTPVALTHRTPHRQEARHFITFLKSAEARRIFTEHGWD
jgi:accessory colonization factor AcfC